MNSNTETTTEGVNNPTKEIKLTDKQYSIQNKARKKKENEN